MGTFDIKNYGDFKKYYDTEQKRNIWVMGYFGGGSVNICDAFEVAKLYAEATGVLLDTVKMDEILFSRRFKHFKYVYSTTQQEPESDAVVMDNVYAWLTD